MCGFRAFRPLIEPDEREMHAEILRRAAARGHPWLSPFALEEIRGFAEDAGCAGVDFATAENLRGRYFTGRDDGLD